MFPSDGRNGSRRETFLRGSTGFPKTPYFWDALPRREATLGPPAETPNNSCAPPSQGRKASDDAANNFFNDLFIWDPL
jgi:hypothetical protein